MRKGAELRFTHTLLQRLKIFATDLYSLYEVVFGFIKEHLFILLIYCSKALLAYSETWHARNDDDSDAPKGLHKYIHTRLLASLNLF